MAGPGDEAAAAAAGAGDDEQLQEWRPAVGRIDRLEVENFKSYRGRQQIGPFRSFTAVVGPNGSGKSNLMDAISFVLGVRTAQLRGSLRELLYGAATGDAAATAAAAGTSSASPAAAASRPRRGYVKLVYETDAGEEVHFTRAIQPSGGGGGGGGAGAEPTYSSVYKINDRVVTWDAYARRLAGFGILVKVRNFLVFQGDIEKVASRSPEQLTQLFEQISGSDALAKPYEQAAAAKAKAEEAAALLFAKKKAVAAERKQKKEQKEEAERHMAAQEELRQRRVYYFLWQLYHLQQDESQALQQQQALADELEQLNARNAGFDAELDERRKRQAGLVRERMALEKSLKKLQKKQEGKDPAKARLHEEARRLTAKINAAAGEADELKKAAKAQAKKVAKLRKDLDALKAARAQLDTDAASGSGSGGVRLDEAQVAEYRSLKAEADGRSSRMLQERAALEAQLRVAEAKLGRLRDAAAAKAARLEAQRARLGDAEAALARAREDVAAAQAQLADRRERAKLAAAEHRRAGSQREYLQGKLRAAEAELAASKGVRQATDRERRLAAAAARLKQEVPGVYGRVSELVKVTNRRYNLAMAVVLQRDLDSVVVRDRAAGFACVDFLKANRLERMDFIPLDSCEARPLPERLRRLGGTATPAADLLAHDAQYERAVAHVCGATLVVDDLEEARALCFGPDHHKVVSLDGTLFRPNGTFTGGRSGDIAARASRWDAHEYERLKAARDKLQQELGALPDAHASAKASQELQNEQQALEQQLKYRRVDEKRAQEELDAARGELQRLEAAAGGRGGGAASEQASSPELAAAERAAEEKRAALRALDARLNEVRDRLFAPFSARVGVASIREWEETTLAAADRLDAERRRHDEQAVRVREQLAYEEQRDLARELQAKQAALEADRAKLDALEAQEKELDAAAAALQQEAGKAAAQVEALRKQGEAAADGVRQLQEQAAGYHRELAKARGGLAAAATALEAVRSARAALLETATLEQVELPRAGGGGGGGGGAAAAEDEEDEEEGEGEEGAATGGSAEAMDADDTPGPSTGGKRGGGGSSGKKKRAEAPFDFGRVTAKHKAAAGKKEREALHRALKEELDAAAAELAASAPNMKALEQYEAVRDKERQQAAALEAARKEAAAAAKAFLRVQQRRTQRFSDAFEHIRASIDAIYKQLTRSAVHPLGGQAYLSLENEDEPFLGGVKYTAMPPTKRFRDMEQLSGGEKSVAALALLFAVHSYRPSPFFVLDEVDAALDATNVARVAHYIRACTRQQQQGGGHGQEAAGGGSAGKRARRGDQGLDGDADADGDDDAAVADGARNRAAHGATTGAGAGQQRLQAFQSIVISLKDAFYEKADALVGVCRDPDQHCSKTLTFSLAQFEPPAEAA